MHIHLFATISVALFYAGHLLAEPIRTVVDQPKSGTVKLNRQTLNSLDRAMQKQVDQQHVSGVVAIVSCHGKTEYYRVFGLRNIEKKLPMTKETLFRIYSMTKPIVAVAAMSIWEEGKFKLDEPISNHLPEWKHVKVKVKGQAQPALSEITPRQLMTHSSGISYRTNGVKIEEQFSLSQFSKSLAQRPIEFQPGSNYVYGYSLDILGRYIEVIEGEPLDVVLKKRLFEPLKMLDTAFWLQNPEDINRLAEVYLKQKPGKLKARQFPVDATQKPSRMMGGQGLVSTAGDYSRFCKMLLNKGELEGKRVLKAKTVELMFKNHLQKIGKTYGLGGIVDAHGGYSWGGAAGTKFWIDTQRNCYGVFMIQRWGYKAPTFSIFKSHVEQAVKVKQENRAE